MIKLLEPDDGVKVSTAGILQKLYQDYRKDGGVDSPDNPFPFFHGRDREKFDPNLPPVLIFRWETDNPYVKTRLEISETEDFGNPAKITMSPPSQSASGEAEYFSDAFNFRSGKTYYWRVTSGDAASETRSFYTDPDDIRAIRVDGLFNVRDIGGAKTSSGKRVRQGMIYRGITPDNCEDDLSGITDEGRRVMREDLGIKTVVDLRNPDEDRPLSDFAKYYAFRAGCYYETLEEDFRKELVRTLRVLFDKDNYPMYIHCAAGADRTGTAVYYVKGLLGVSDIDIMTDYMMTGLSLFDDEKDYWYIEKQDVRRHMEELKKRYPDSGESIAELIYSDVLDLGFTPEEIDSFRELMSE